jgi:hypothetical protein
VLSVPVLAARSTPTELDRHLEHCVLRGCAAVNFLNEVISFASVFGACSVARRCLPAPVLLVLAASPAPVWPSQRVGRSVHCCRRRSQQTRGHCIFRARSRAGAGAYTSTASALPCTQLARVRCLGKVHRMLATMDANLHQGKRSLFPPPVRITPSVQMLIGSSCRRQCSARSSRCGAPVVSEPQRSAHGTCASTQHRQP